MLSRIGRFCYQRRVWVFGVWLLVMAVGGVAFSPLFNSLALNKPSQGMESNVARQVLTTEGDYYDKLIAVVDGGDLRSVPAQDAMGRAVDEVRGITGIKEVADPVASPDGSAAQITVRFGKLPKTEKKRVLTEASDRLHKVADDVPGSKVVIGGDEPQAQETNATSGADTLRAELSTLPIILIALVVVFGGLLAALLPLLAAIGAVCGAIAMVLVFSTFLNLDSTVMSVVTLLGLGLSIDYGLLLVARYRDELAVGHAPEVAAARTWATAGRTILFSGLTVSAALSGLLAFDVARLQTMGAAGISATLIAMAAALTLTSALLGFFGKHIRPSKKAISREARADSSEIGAFAKLARFIQGRPVVITVIASAFLVLLTLPAFTATPKLPQLAGLPRDVMESARAADVLQDKFGLAVQPPVVVVARTDAATLDQWAQRWADDPAKPVARPAEQTGENLSTVSFDMAGDSQSEAAQEFVKRVRADRPPAETWVLGDAAVIVDLWDKTVDGLPLAITIMLLSMFVLLFLMTGSLAVPLKAIFTNVLSLGATIGVMVAIFQHGFLAGPLDALVVGGLSPYILLLVSAFAFGFSMDYEVFLLGRIKEHVDEGMETNTAVRRGLQRSGRIITSAAVLVLIVFTGFTIADLADVEELGIGLFLAVLIDATLVRCVLVPSTMTLLGKWNWWTPRFLHPIRDRFGLREHEDVPTGTRRPENLEPAGR
ncbi:MMPL family transporter [Saccharothrix violaceirubra]|uniref:RND superfamily putative drug exporter n=1 Tax=Saccharothrix violaceirubra TaxID=413306 RepID=A0A7W7WXM4_9PSEU|nr:MMPL family transporter [Saccharothrix violaceirubra]MBB4967277.1 RND superfamily putative drug exporter [Saccharothrix violaceirubra]